MYEPKFSHLRAVKDGDKAGVVPVTLLGYEAPHKRGFVPPGNYAGVVVDASWQVAASGNGVNLTYTARTAGPADFAGVEIEHRIYIPFDDALQGKSEQEIDAEATDPKSLAGQTRMAYTKLQHLLRSIASHDEGKVEKISAPKADGSPQYAPIEPAKLIGKTVYFETQRGGTFISKKDGKKVDLSSRADIKWHIGREDYEKAPGPFTESATGTGTGTSTGGSAAKGGAEQRSAPELTAGGSGGNGAKNGSTTGSGSGKKAETTAAADAVSDLLGDL